MKENIQRRWQLRKMMTIYVLSAIVAILLFPGTDPLCQLRYALFAIISVAYWIRVVVAMQMNDQSNSDTLWVALIIIAPPVIFALGLGNML